MALQLGSSEADGGDADGARLCGGGDSDDDGAPEPPPLHESFTRLFYSRRPAVRQSEEADRSAQPTNKTQGVQLMAACSAVAATSSAAAAAEVCESQRWTLMPLARLPSNALRTILAEAPLYCRQVSAPLPLRSSRAVRCGAVPARRSLQTLRRPERHERGAHMQVCKLWDTLVCDHVRVVSLPPMRRTRAPLSADALSAIIVYLSGRGRLEADEEADGEAEAAPPMLPQHRFRSLFRIDLAHARVAPNVVLTEAALATLRGCPALTSLTIGDGMTLPMRELRGDGEAATIFLDGQSYGRRLRGRHCRAAAGFGCTGLRLGLAKGCPCASSVGGFDLAVLAQAIPPRREHRRRDDAAEPFLVGAAHAVDVSADSRPPQAPAEQHRTRRLSRSTACCSRGWHRGPVGCGCGCAARWAAGRAARHGAVGG